ncbi:MAG: HAD family hydrolase [Ktedonobacterales bacterium]|nr:HAD family hydrolase [Ktedonobacterales bacterium]
MTIPGARPSLTVRGLILDVDGTLVLSNDAHAHAWYDALQESGHGVPYDAIRPLIGMGGDQLLPRVVPGLESTSAEGKQIAQRRKAIFREKYLPHVSAAPGSQALVQALRARGLHLIVGSSADSDELESLLHIAGIADLLPERTTAQDAQHTKPAPDITQVALERLGLPPMQVAMLGDSPYDIQSSQQVGVPLIALRCGGFSASELQGAYALYQDPQDLLTHLDTLFDPMTGDTPTTNAAR